MRNLGIGVTAVVVAVAVLVGGTFAALGWRYLIAGPSGRVAQEQTIQSAPYRIAAYERFFDLCVQVQADEFTIEALRDELKTSPPEARRTQVNASITALRASRAEKISQYNADAAKEGTRAQFRSSRLPYQLNVAQEVTVCAV